MLTRRRARFSESLEAGRYGTAGPDNRMLHALSALLHYLPRLSGRPAPPSPAPSAHLLGRTIYREKTERIGAARPLHFPCNRTFRCTSGSFGGRSAYVKEKTKTKKNWRGGGGIEDGRKNHYGVFPAVPFTCCIPALMACDPSPSSSESPSFHPPSPAPTAPLVSPSVLSPLLSSHFFPSPLSVRPSVCPSAGCVALHHR